MTCVSTWYQSLSYYTFPTLFVYLKSDDRKSLLDGDHSSMAAKAVTGKIQRAIRYLPGSCFIHADCCAPTDSESFSSRSGAVTTGVAGWQMLMESEKVAAALQDNRTERIGIHSYRRMDRSREFRIFLRERELVGMSQRYLGKHHPRLEKRRSIIWAKAKVLADDVQELLPAPNQIIDVYLTSNDDMIIIDLNDWGAPTDSLLLRDWDRDWAENTGLQLVPKPVRLSGEVSVSF